MPTPSDTQMRELLDLERIAVVGCSRTPGKAAHDIPRYLVKQGYDVIPVNPNAEAIFDRKAYDSLTDVSEHVDLVDVFRPSVEVPGIVEETIERDDIRAIWMQLGIRHDEAVRRAEEAGLSVVQDRCIKVEHRRLS